MFEENFEVKIVDFGTSKQVIDFVTDTVEGESDVVYSTSTGSRGTWSHMAPEMIVK